MTSTFGGAKKAPQIVLGCLLLLLSSCQYDPYVISYCQVAPKKSDLVGKYYAVVSTVKAIPKAEIDGMYLELHADGTYEGAGLKVQHYGQIIPLPRGQEFSGPWTSKVVSAGPDELRYWGIELGNSIVGGSLQFNSG